MIKLICAIIAGAIIALLSSNMSEASDESQFLGIDRDGNQLISQEEAINYRRNLFKEYDLNQDNTVNFEEYVQANRLRPNTAVANSDVPVPDEFREMDQDGDTNISMDESDQMGMSRFKALDEDGDGQISKDEFQSPGL
jgi:Ca2+-binding EF-hand superfamily protein